VPDDPILLDSQRFFPYVAVTDKVTDSVKYSFFDRAVRCFIHAGFGW
jgi:hypothetical protein